MCIRDSPSSAEPEPLLQAVLGSLRDTTISYAAYKNKIRNREKKDVEKALKLATDNYRWAPTPENRSFLEAATIDSTNYLEAEDKLAKKRLEAHVILDSDKPSQWYLNLAKSRGGALAIPFLRIPMLNEQGVQKVNAEGDGLFKEIHDQKEILDVIHSTYKKIFTSTKTTATIPEFLSNHGKDQLPPIPQVPDEIKTELEKDITIEELWKSLKNLKNTSFPGGDGFNAKFYKIMWPSLKHLIFKAINAGKRKGEMTQIMRMGIITLIPKGDKDRTLINNWRPISLLSVIYKILSGAIANRFKKALPHIIHPSQKAYLPGRFIGGVTRSIFDIQYHTQTKHIEALILLVDFSKAFDSIEHSFIDSTLAKFGFGANFSSWIKLLLTKRFACITLAGNNTQRFTLDLSLIHI